MCYTVRTLECGKHFFVIANTSAMWQFVYVFMTVVEIDFYYHNRFIILRKYNVKHVHKLGLCNTSVMDLLEKCFSLCLN